MLNGALFGLTAKEWRDNNHEAVRDIRDNVTVYQLIVFVNLESMNAELIKQQISQKDRLKYLNKMAIENRGGRKCKWAFARVRRIVLIWCIGCRLSMLGCVQAVSAV